jgi:Flp pilus assembly protein TadG
MFRPKPNSPNHLRRGAAVVELAITLPLIVLIVLGTIETCSMLFLKQALRISAYEGVRVAIVQGATADNITAGCDLFLNARKIKNGVVAITPSDFANRPYGTIVTVRVSADCASNSTFVPILYSGRTLDGEMHTFNASSSKKNSVQITANRNGSALDGPLPLFMPNLLVRSSVNITQSAIGTAIDVDIALVLDRSGSMAFAVDEVAQTSTPPYSAPPGWAFCDPAPPICRWRNLDSAVAAFLNEVTTSPLDDSSLIRVTLR